jgi:uncharacterized iron-regulated membrane protein
MGIGTGLQLVVITLVTMAWVGLVGLGAWVFWLATELKAMQKSTHSIQYVPVDGKVQAMTDETRDSLSRDLFENLG